MIPMPGTILPGYAAIIAIITVVISVQIILHNPDMLMEFFPI
jgi:hypothetical protein